MSHTYLKFYKNPARHMLYLFSKFVEYILHLWPIPYLCTDQSDIWLQTDYSMSNFILIGATLVSQNPKIQHPTKHKNWLNFTIKKATSGVTRESTASCCVDSCGSSNWSIRRGCRYIGLTGRASKQIPGLGKCREIVGIHVVLAWWLSNYRP